AGQYIMGLALEAFTHFSGAALDRDTEVLWRERGAVVIAVLITLYFFRQNLLGIHESSDKALKIMIATTVMGVVVIGWCLLTLALEGGPRTRVPLLPDLNPHTNYSPYPPETLDPLGFLSHTGLGERLRGLGGADWLSLVGAVGILLAFGHSILAMSGEETLAQVLREVGSHELRD